MAVASPAAETVAYVTTERVGSRVAGRVVEPGKADQDLSLTAEEAAFDLGEGAIVPKGKKLSGGFADASKKADAIRADIAAEQARYARVRAGARDEAAAAPAAAPAPAAPPKPTKSPEPPPAEAGGGQPA